MPNRNKFLKKFEEMSPEYFSKWEKAKNFLQPILDKELENNKFNIFSDIAYTPHDYSRHCKGLYRNLDKMLNDDVYNKIGDEGLYYLACSVLLHDVAMAVNPLCRDYHADAGAKITFGDIKIDILTDNYYGDINRADLLDFTFNKYSSFVKSIIEEIIGEREREIIAYIILGHSDIKFKGERINILKELDKANIVCEDSNADPIDIQLLAVLLRLADELDVTNHRIADLSPEIYSLSLESTKHWDKLRLIKKVDIRDDGNIKLIVSNNIIRDNYKYYFKLLYEVENKINGELQNLRETSLYSRVRWMNYNKVLFVFGERLEDDYNRFVADRLDGTVFSTIDSDVVSEVEEFIKVKNLIKEVHYRISESYCIRDYVDTHDIISNTELLNNISLAYHDKLNEIWNDYSNENTYAIGIDIEGMIMAANFSINYDIAFSYVLSNHLTQKHDEHDRIVRFDTFPKYLIIFISAVVSCNTIDKAINYLIEVGIISGESSIAVFTILERKPAKLFTEYRKYKEIIKTKNGILEKYNLDSGHLYAITSKFDVEICPKNPNQCLQCLYSSDNHKKEANTL